MGAAAAADLYLELMKRCLTREAFPERYRSLTRAGWKGRLTRGPQRALEVAGLALVRTMRRDDEARSQGTDWPAEAETMIGRQRLDNLHGCITQVLTDGVPGDLIETGVWRGGAVILMRAVLAAHRTTDRTVWVADSFCGLPPPDPGTFPADAGDTLWRHSRLAIGVDEVKANFSRYQLLDRQVQFLPGWFRDTLPSAPIERLAVMRLDGDLYESTMVALEALYPKLSVGGYVIVDDYGSLEPCRMAVHDYRNEHGVVEEIVPVDRAAIYWRRES